MVAITTELGRTSISEGVEFDKTKVDEEAMEVRRKIVPLLKKLHRLIQKKHATPFDGFEMKGTGGGIRCEFPILGELLISYREHEKVGIK